MRWSPAWTVESTGTALVLSAGADLRVAVDGLDESSRRAAADWRSGGPVEPDGATQHQLVDRLVEVGALIPDLTPPVTVVGDVALPLTGCVFPANPDRSSGLVVAVRTGAAWPTVPDGAVHLGLDLSLHHTIVVGPLVLPGASACLGCLDRRMARRWGAPAVPDRPAAREALAVAAALAGIQVELALHRRSPLVNATIAWNLRTGETDRQHLYKFPGCPGCEHYRTTGRVTLPWEAAPCP